MITNRKDKTKVRRGFLKQIKHDLIPVVKNFTFTAANASTCRKIKAVVNKHLRTYKGLLGAVVNYNTSTEVEGNVLKVTSKVKIFKGDPYFTFVLMIKPADETK